MQGLSIREYALQPEVFEATAYHEAGHAAYAFLLRIPILSITVEPDGDALGRIRLVHPPRLPRFGTSDEMFLVERQSHPEDEAERLRERRRLSDLLAHTLAGVAAEYIHGDPDFKWVHPNDIQFYVQDILDCLDFSWGENWLREWKSGAQSDRQHIIRLSRALSYQDENDKERRIERRMKGVVNAFFRPNTWAGVETLAVALMDRKTLSGCEAKQIFRAGSQNVLASSGVRKSKVSRSKMTTKAHH